MAAARRVSDPVPVRVYNVFEFGSVIPIKNINFNMDPSLLNKEYSIQELYSAILQSRGASIIIADDWNDFVVSIGVNGVLYPIRSEFRINGSKVKSLDVHTKRRYVNVKLYRSGKVFPDKTFEGGDSFTIPMLDLPDLMPYNPEEMCHKVAAALKQTLVDHRYMTQSEAFIRNAQQFFITFVKTPASCRIERHIITHRQGGRKRSKSTWIRRCELCLQTRAQAQAAGHSVAGKPLFILGPATK